MTAYRVTVTDHKITDRIIYSEECGGLEAAKDAAWFLAMKYPHDIVQYEEIRMTDPTTPTTDEATVPVTPPWDAAEPEDTGSERRPRRKRVATVAIPEQIHALSILTGTEPEQIIEGIVAREVAALVDRAKAVLSAGA